jgi:thioredoxin reductase (NADPH)
MLYKDKHVCVVGGGNTALTEALYLSNICKTVTLIVRKDKYRADEVLVNKVNQQSNIIQLMESTIEEFCGENKLNHVIIKTNDKIASYDTSAVFVAIGSEKNDEILKNSFGDNYNINDLPLNIKLCGDLIEAKHQAVIAAASGAKVAMDIIEK